MSYLSEKFNIPEGTVKNMISNGVISCSWQSYEEILKLRKEGKSVADIAYLTNRSESSVYYVLSKFPK